MADRSHEDAVAETLASTGDPVSDGVAETVSSDEARDASATPSVARRIRPPEAPTSIGRYRVLRRLGAGGMGVVYAAQDPALDRTVAIKVVRDHLEGDSPLEERLRREAQALARLHHPGVVSVYDVGVDQGQLYVVMQHVDGTSLDRWLAEAEPSRDEILRRFLEAGRGLAAAHAAGLIHRDFKPGNVLVDRDGTVRVTDFGLARLGGLTDLESSGSVAADTPLTLSVTMGDVVGTPAYMAPEQFARAPVTAATDQFAFCVALWEALFGARPFPGETFGELARSVKAGDITPPRGASGTWARVERVLRRGLATDPKVRFSGMDALLAALTPNRRGVLLIGAGAIAVAACAAVAVFGLGGGSHRAAAEQDSDAGSPAAPAMDPLFAIARPGELRRLSFDNGCEENPQLSPDGRTVYYDGEVGSDYHLFALDVAGGAPRELTTTTGWDLAPAPSPDGTQLAFLRRDSEKMATYIAPLAHLDQARMIQRGGMRPSWSPDGGFLWVGGRKGIDRIDLATTTSVRHLDPPEGEMPLQARELADGNLLVLFTPSDGSALANKVGLYRPDDTEPRWIYDEGALDEVLAIAPDQRSFWLARHTGTATIEILRIALADGSARQEGSGAIGARKRMDVSASGRLLVWSDCSENTGFALLEDAPGGGLRVVDSQRSTWSDAEPVPVPGTQDLVFLSDRDAEQHVWRSSLDRPGVATRVRFGDLQPIKLALSPDGTLLAAAEGEKGLFVAPLDDSQPPRLLTPDPGALNPAFDRRGERIYFERADGDGPRIASVAVAGGEARWEVDGRSMAPAPSPIADQLAFLTQTDTGTAIHVLDLATGKDRVLRAAPRDLPWRLLRFSPDGKRLIVMRENGGLLELDARNGKPLRGYESGAEGFLGVAYVGDRIVLARTKWIGDIWVRELLP